MRCGLASLRPEGRGIVKFAKLFRNATLRRLARNNAVRVPGLCALFGALVFAMAYFAREPAATPGVLIVSGGGAGMGPARAIGGLSTGGLAADDPVAQFAQTRVGQLLYAPIASDNCRRVLFSNETGGSYETTPVLCGPAAGKSDEATSGDRIQALRKSFQKERASSR
jgi:hypothetical protein